MPRSVLRVGTRGSALALARAERVRQGIAGIITHRNFELVPITTAVDDAPTPSGDVAVREIQEALALGKIDLAVHAAKDLPVDVHEGVVLAATPERDDPREALVTRSGVGLDGLAPGTSVGTSSMRRAAQVLALHRGLVPMPVGGTVDARLRDLSDGRFSAVVLALAALKRLNRADRIAEVLPVSVMLPAPGQGTVAVECRANDKLMRPALEQMNDPAVRAAFEAERSVVAALDADLRAPIAALAEARDGSVRLRALVVSPDGGSVVQEQLDGDDPEKVGIMLAERLRANGADDLLARAAE